MRTACLVTALCLGGVLLPGCDSAPGPEAARSRPPVLSDFALSPVQVDLGQVPPDWIVGDNVRIPLEVSVAVQTGDEALAEVGYVVQAPAAGAPPLASGVLEAAAGRQYAATVPVEIPAAEVGVYTVLVFAVDARGQLSNQMRGLLRFAAAGGPPVIERIEAPDVVQRPSPGNPAVPLKVVAVVTDPDGLANLAQVLFWNASRPDATFPMADDGENGDDVAGDGHYTTIVQVESSNQPGTNTLAFQAFDRSGLASEVVEKQITIE
jgi:hypothetical protein